MLIVVCVFPFISVIDHVLLFLYGSIFFVYAHSLGVIIPTFLPHIHYFTSVSLSPFILIVVFDQRPFLCRCCHRRHFSASLAAPASTAADSSDDEELGDWIYKNWHRLEGLE